MSSRGDGNSAVERENAEWFDLLTADGCAPGGVRGLAKDYNTLFTTFLHLNCRLEDHVGVVELGDNFESSEFRVLSLVDWRFSEKIVNFIIWCLVRYFVFHDESRQ